MSPNYLGLALLSLISSVLLLWMTFQPILYILYPKPLSYDTVEFMCYNRTAILKMKNNIHFLPPFPSLAN